MLQKAVLAPLADAGVETELVELAGSEIRGCMSCFMCFLQKDGTCVLKKDAVNDFFLLTKMIIVGSDSWNAGIGPEKGEVVDDEEAMKNMRLLGENMVWLLKKLQA